MVATGGSRSKGRARVLDAEIARKPDAQLSADHVAEVNVTSPLEHSNS
jgi:hypothetical protein